jgi:hypothetical protein
MALWERYGDREIGVLRGGGWGRERVVYVNLKRGPQLFESSVFYESFGYAFLTCTLIQLGGGELATMCRKRVWAS